MEREWEAERSKYERELRTTHEGHKAILKQVEDSKNAVQRLEAKVKDAERQKHIA